LQYYEKDAVEDPVTQIMNRLSTLQQIEGRLIFDYSHHPLREPEEAQEHRPPLTPRRNPQSSHSSTAPSTTPEFDISSTSDPRVRRTYPDQFCVYQITEFHRSVIFIVEYKPPHKLSIGNLRAGFREMNLKDDVLQRLTRPSEEEAEERLQYNADKLVAAVATQAFSYMIDSGLEYGYTTTGEAFVFLHIDYHDPTVLFYHVTAPNDEVEDNGHFQHSSTATGQVASFCMMAFQSKQ
jgi:hypothetical protein